MTAGHYTDIYNQIYIHETYIIIFLIYEAHAQSNTPHEGWMFLLHSHFVIEKDVVSSIQTNHNKWDVENNRFYTDENLTSLSYLHCYCNKFRILLIHTIDSLRLTIWLKFTGDDECGSMLGSQKWEQTNWSKQWCWCTSSGGPLVCQIFLSLNQMNHFSSVSSPLILD